MSGMMPLQVCIIRHQQTLGEEKINAIKKIEKAKISVIN